MIMSQVVRTQLQVQHDSCTKLTELQANGNLQSYLNDLLGKNICLQMPEREVCDIRDAVEEMVEKLLEVWERDDRRIEVEEVIKVGSSYDGTKIGLPDEFDFLVVLDQQRFADGRKLEVRKDYLGQLEFVDGDDYMYNGDIFFESMSHVLSRFREHLFDTIMKTTGVLNNVYAWELNGPATTLWFSWKGSQEMEISVDIVPAIRMSNVENRVSRSEVKYEKLYETLLETGTFLMIRKQHVLQMTFTETEATVIKEQFPQKHRNVLKLLKYLYKDVTNGMSTCRPIPSYTLKQYAIHHHYMCIHDDTKSIAHCMVDVLEYMQRSEYYYHSFRLPQSFLEPVCSEDRISCPTDEGQHYEVRIPHLFLKWEGYFSSFMAEVFTKLLRAYLHFLLDIAGKDNTYSFEECEQLRKAMTDYASVNCNP